MNISECYPQLEQFLMSMKGVEKDFKAEWEWTRFMLKGKMFCAFCADGKDNALITVKCEPDFNQFIREQYKDAIIEGYYMNKVHWNSIKPDKNVPYELIQEMCQRGYNLILKSLTKKAQKEIENLN